MVVEEPVEEDGVWNADELGLVETPDERLVLEDVDEGEAGVEVSEDEDEDAAEEPIEKRPLKV